MSVALSLFGVDPVLLAIAVGMLLVVFFVYLFLRRTLLSVREGYDEGRRR